MWRKNKGENLKGYMKPFLFCVQFSPLDGVSLILYKSLFVSPHIHERWLAFCLFSFAFSLLLYSITLIPSHLLGE